MRKFYELPKMEIVQIDVEDVITASGLEHETEGGGTVYDWNTLF